MNQARTDQESTELDDDEKNPQVDPEAQIQPILASATDDDSSSIASVIKAAEEALSLTPNGTAPPASETPASTSEAEAAHSSTPTPTSEA